MSQVLIGLVSVALMIALAIYGASSLAPKLKESRVEAEAVRYLAERQQIDVAVDAYTREMGKVPEGDGHGGDAMAELVAVEALRDRPTGGTTKWQYNAPMKSFLTPIKGTVNEALRICHAARRAAQMPAPTTVYNCDGSNAPGGVLELRDPCCLGS